MHEQGKPRHRAQNMRSRLRMWARRSLASGLAFAVTCGAIVPFLEGHGLHRFWNSARYLIFLAEALFLVFVLCLGSTWAAWKVLHDTSIEPDDPSDGSIGRD